MKTAYKRLNRDYRIELLGESMRKKRSNNNV